MRCCEEAGVSGNGEEVVDKLGDDREGSDEIMSPNESKDDVIEGKKKMPRRQFSKFNKNVRPENVNLISKLLFTDKKQLKKVMQTCKIQNGYSVKVTKHDKQRY